MSEPLFTAEDVALVREVEDWDDDERGGWLFPDRHRERLTSLADRLERYVATDRLRQIADLSPTITAALDQGKSVEIGVQANGVHRILRIIDESDVSEG